MTAPLDQILREFREGLERIYGCRLVRVVLFGSRARNDAEPDSDIDLLVVLQGPVNAHQEILRNSSFIVQLSLNYETLVSCVYMSEDKFLDQESPLMMNIRREGVLV